MNMLKIPLYNQYNDPLPDGRQDPFASADCGEECVSMVGAAYGYGGACGYAAGQVRVIMRRGSLSGIGLSTASDLVYALQACFKLVATDHECEWGTARQVVTVAYEQRRPCLALGLWDGPLHWVVIARVNNEGVTGLDPAGGFVHMLPWVQFQELYRSSLVELRQPLP